MDELGHPSDVELELDVTVLDEDVDEDEQLSEAAAAAVSGANESCGNAIIFPFSMIALNVVI